MCIFAVAAFVVNVILQTHPYNYEANWNGPEKRVVWNSSGGGWNFMQIRGGFYKWFQMFLPMVKRCQVFWKMFAAKTHSSVRRISV